MSRVPGVLDSKIFIANIPCTVTEEALKELIFSFGTVLQFFYVSDKKSGDRGFAFFTFEKTENAKSCESALHATIHFENSIRPLHVSFANSKTFSGEAFVDPGKLVPSAHWREYKTDEGFAYYHNAETDETVWEKPEHFTQNPATVSEMRTSGLGPRGANLFCESDLDKMELSKFV